MDQRERLFQAHPRTALPIPWVWGIQGHVNNTYSLRTSSASHKPGRMFLLQTKKVKIIPNMTILECVFRIGSGCPQKVPCFITQCSSQSFIFTIFLARCEFLFQYWRLNTGSHLWWAGILSLSYILLQFCLLFWDKVSLISSGQLLICSVAQTSLESVVLQYQPPK